MTTRNEALTAHAAAFWADVDAADYEAHVNATYAAYLAAGGNDHHYKANWRAASNAAHRAAHPTMNHADCTACRLANEETQQ